MCGFAGYYSPYGFLSREDLSLMSKALEHRGPDAEGYFLEGCAGLAHHRLSILDLSHSADQPMHSHCKRYVMAYNGEVYNFREIRQEIEKETGLKFTTSSDSEVVLEAFALWGPDCVQRFNGMFAIAVYDKQKQELFLMRDRLGIKPLFVFQHEKELSFASELKAFLAVPKINTRLGYRNESFSEFLHLGYIPEPHTAWKEIRKFPSGCYAMYDGEKLQITPYWKPESCLVQKPLADEHEAFSLLKNLLVSSVSMRLVSDVPFGAFLSGGIDSSLVTAIAQSVHNGPLNTFSIGFENTAYDESAFARSIAQHLHTKHHEITLTEKDAIDLLPSLTDIYDEPFADSSAVPTLLVSAMARKHVTMTLSGDGGDELFMGYGAYQWAQRLEKPGWKIARQPLGTLMKLGSGRQKRIADLLLHEKPNLQSHIFSQEQYLFSAREIRALLIGKTDFAGFPFLLSDVPRTLNAAGQQAFFDLTHYLKDDLLVKVDRASMHHSLETRVPLLDYRIVEFALNLDYGLKHHKGSAKYLLKKVLYSYLPEKLFDRPKWGFAIPLRKWLKGPLKGWMMDSLSEETIKKHNLVSPLLVKELLKKYLETDSEYLYNRLWALMTLHNFLEKSK